MRLGTILLWGDLAVFRDQLALAEELGYEVIGIGDSPSAWHELYVSLTVAALHTRSALLTPMVTAPFLRHPFAAASAMSSLHELTGGRVALTIGSGGSALRSIGRPRAASPAELGGYVRALRALLEGGVAEVDGFTTAQLTRARPLPVQISADSPKGLRLAGELADTVVMSVGLNLDLVDRKITQVRAAAEAAGRDPDSVDVWGMSFVSVRGSRAEANADISAFLASTAGMGLKAPHMRALIPPDLLPAVKEIEVRYDPRQHVVVGGSNARLVEELGLTEFVTGLNSITGDEQQVATHLRELERRGVSCVLAALPGNADPDGTLRRFAAAGRAT